eukprot:scaffold843_cov255-Pinguiococcus_pyrenoidosus.AAC.5
MRALSVGRLGELLEASDRRRRKRRRLGGIGVDVLPTKARGLGRREARRGRRRVGRLRAAGRGVGAEGGPGDDDLLPLHDAAGAALQLGHDAGVAGADRPVAGGGVPVAILLLLHGGGAAHAEAPERRHGREGRPRRVEVAGPRQGGPRGLRHAEVRALELGHGGLHGAAERPDALDDHGEVLELEQVHGLEHVMLRDAERAARAQEVADVLHLLERQLALVDLAHGAAANGVHQHAQHLPVLERLSEVPRKRHARHGFDPLLGVLHGLRVDERALPATRHLELRSRETELDDDVPRDRAAEREKHRSPR